VLLLELYQEKIQKQSLLVVNRIKEIGINAYKQEIGYSFRNIVEGFFSIPWVRNYFHSLLFLKKL